LQTCQAKTNGLAIFYITNMEKKNTFLANVAETSKIGLVGIFTGLFCVVFSVIYTV